PDRQCNGRLNQVISPIRRSLAAVSVMVALCAPTHAQTVNGTNITVREPLGIRRTEYPVAVRVPLPKGAVADLTHLRLRTPVGNDGNDGNDGKNANAGMEVAAQFTADERWPDGSAQWVALDFNASIGPGETRV